MSKGNFYFATEGVLDVQIEAMGTFLIIVGAHMNILCIIKVKVLVLSK